MQSKKVIESIRTCLYSNKKYNKKDLIRLVKVYKKIIIDWKQNMPGRGYYICPTSQALNDSHLIQILSKRCHCDINTELIDELKSKLQKERN